MPVYASGNSPMRPFLIPGGKILDSGGTFNGFVIQPEPGMLHSPVLPDEQATEGIFRHSRNFAFRFPVACRVPLACSTLTFKIEPENNF